MSDVIFIVTSWDTASQPPEQSPLAYFSTEEKAMQFIEDVHPTFRRDTYDETVLTFYNEILFHAGPYDHIGLSKDHIDKY